MCFLKLGKPILRLASAFGSLLSCGPRYVVTACKTIIDVAKTDTFETLEPFAVFRY